MKTIILTIAFLPAAALAQVPVTFEAGTPARAAEVNQNFEALNGRIDDSIGSVIISGVTASDGSGVASATCPADRIAISANCDCDSENGARNAGVLFGCQVAGNGGVVGCFNEPVTFNPALPEPMATIVVGCISATTNDGTPLDPQPIVLKGAPGASKTVTSMDAVDELDAAIKSAREQAEDHKARLRER